MKMSRASNFLGKTMMEDIPNRSWETKHVGLSKVDKNLARIEQLESSFKNGILSNDDDDDDVLNFPEIPNMILPFLGNKLYIRPCYRNIEHIITSSDQNQNFLILGTSGVGKRCFLIYLLYQLFHKNKTVVLHKGGYDKSIYLVKEQKFYELSNIDDVSDELQNPDVWYLADTVDNLRMQRAKLVFVSSICPTRYRKIAKQLDVRTLYMPVWEGEDLLELYNTLPSKTKENLPLSIFKERCNIFGGVPRTVMISNNTVDNVIHAINRSSIKSLVHPVSEISPFELDGDVSDIIVHVTSDVDDDYCVPRIVYASHFVERKIYERIKEYFGDQFPSFLRRILATASK
eukprot:TRINITY_DN11674_c0_g1_i1.p1 TRINITY_DN11674_c0_g1~~TRINITY_DN11674_c0_g1_i1.p1  ORF type:complete len:345 (-),score=42.42 TRINITY_DN11674_c0_g1_i1:227-1261(-)